MSNYLITQLPITLGKALREAKTRLAEVSSTPTLDVQVLLAHTLQRSRTWLLTHPEAELTPQQQAALEKPLRQLESGIPLPYVIGEWEFYGLKFSLSKDVLIPRPETELLVETALAWINQNFSSGEILHAADIGTGSGCIAITLAAHLPNLHILATDISPVALQIARYNAEKHNVAHQITFLHADLLQLPITNYPLHLILANLPYIPTPTLHTLAVYEREPTLALDGGPDGLALIRRLLPQAAGRLAPGGIILLEIEATQGDQALPLAKQHFPNARVEVKPDLAGHPRLLVVKTLTH